MTTKKVLLLIVGVAAGLALIVALFVGAIFGFVFYGIGHSQAAQTAKAFLRSNERLTKDVGAVRDFGWLTTGSVNSQSGAGNAELHLKVVGERKNVNATVALALGGRGEWRVVDAYYDGDAGRRVYLTKNFDEDAEASKEENGGDGDDLPAEVESSEEGGPEKFDERSFEANVLRADGPVLVVIGSASSLDSRAFDDTLRAVAPKYEERVNLVQYEIGEQPALLQRFNVQSVPTVIVFKGGQERERRAGQISPQELARLLDKYLQ